MIVEKPLPQADVIFVMGGSSTFVERTHKAAEIFHQKRAAKIILTNDGQRGGWKREERRNLYYWELAQRELEKQGVPPEAIEVLPQQVERTHDEAVLLAENAKSQDWHSVLVVTSGYHTRRALWTIEHVLNEKQMELEVGIESPPAGQQTPLAFAWWLSRKGWNLVGGEYLKFAYYWLFY